jgi:hypothetical protein
MRRTVRPIKGFGVVAAFRHFHGLSEDVSAELSETGNIRVLLLDDGWAWLIPLVGRRLSFGVVSRKRGVDTSILDAVEAASPFVQRLVAGAERTEGRMIRHFSYQNVAPHGARFACVGDAGTFLDPVFSSGVTLAMLGGEMAVDALVPALAEGREGAPDLMHPCHERMNHVYRCFGSLIQSFYSTDLFRHLFFHPNPEPNLRAGLISMLAGDVFRDDNRFQQMLITGRRRWEPSTGTPPQAAGAVA